MILTLPSPLVWAILTSARSPCATFTSRNWSPTLIPFPDSMSGVALKSTLWPSPATALPSATGRFLYMKSLSADLPMPVHPATAREKAMIGRLAVRCFMMVAPYVSVRDAEDRRQESIAVAGHVLKVEEIAGDAGSRVVAAPIAGYDRR